MDMRSNQMLPRFVILIITIISAHCDVALDEDSIELSPEKQLIRRLLTQYEKLGRNGRPVRQDNDTLVVQYGLSLIQILDLDERNQVLSINVWASYIWTDIYLTWNPQDYGNITKVRVPSNTIWLPDIKLYNYADARLDEKRPALCVVSHTGSIQWMPQAIFKSSCAIDIMHFPFDVQTCKLKFGSWTYDGNKIDLSFLYEIDTGFEFSDFVQSNEWDIVSSSAKKNVLMYTCCEEPFIDLTFELVIKRKPAFYNYILILPCILLSSLTLVLFWLPPESPAKMQLGMNIFVAFFVLLLLLAESTPPAASNIPLIGAYYCLNMIMITLSTFLSVIVVNLYFRGSRTEVPHLVKLVFVRFLARVMCMYDQVKDSNENKGRGLKMNNVNRKNDKVSYWEPQSEESWKCLPNGVEGTPPAPSALHVLECDVREIKLFLKDIMTKADTKEKKDLIAREWRVVALVLDRLFFFFYLLAILVSVFTVFDKALFGFSS